MACNVFGNPITNITLQELPEYIDKKITRLDRAKVALNLKNTQNKDTDARRYVENVKDRWGKGVSTLCLIYNATGDRITFVGSLNWFGHIGPAPYPIIIENGQWGAFLHVKRTGTASGSVAAVVYRGKNADGKECDWMLSWSNPFDRNLRDNKVFTEVREAHHYETNFWRIIKRWLDNSGHQHRDEWKGYHNECNGCVSTMATGSFTSPVVEAILGLSNVL